MPLKLENPKPTRQMLSVRLEPEMRETLDELVKLYDRPAGRIIDAILRTYGPVLIRDAKREQKK